MGMGMFLLRRVYEGYLSGEATRDLPVDGIQKGWWRMDRRGSFIGICIFILGAGFLGGPGCSRVGLCMRVDVRQAAAGRMESGVEIRDNVAAFPCGEVLLDRSRRRISRREAAERLREILAE